MFKYLSILLLSGSFFPGNAQTKLLPAEARPFVLKGYEMKDYITGDLNGDKRPDAILILKVLGEDTVFTDFQNTPKRPFIILIRQANGKLKQAKRNDNAEFCGHCGGAYDDPYINTIIKNNGFTIDFQGGAMSSHWHYTYKFAYNQAKTNWYLVYEKQVNRGAPDLIIDESELKDVAFENFSSGSSTENSKWKVTVAKTFFYDNPKLGSKPRKGYLVKGNQATGIRELKNFIELNFDSPISKTVISGFVLKKDLLRLN